MRKILVSVLLLAFGADAQAADEAPLLPPAQSAAIAQEVSGSAALRNVRALSLHHRMRASDGYRAAAEIVRARLAEYGLEEAETIELPVDGTLFYGTQRSRPSWNVTFAELWEQRPEGERWVDGERIASWAEQPLALAQDSVSGRAEAELVDVGEGSKEADYAGKDVRGKLVLVSAQPESVEALAIGRYGAAGIVSWAQNQKTAWWGQDDTLVRWGHLLTFPEHPTFAFMVAPRQARAWQERLRLGEPIRLRAEVEAGREPGAYLFPTAVIPGRKRNEEIVYSCHLDHPSPGANDNASGCAGILEVARTLHRLIAGGALPRPERTIRFLWPSEIEGTIALLNARPEFARRTLATIHLDMIGGDTEVTKSILRVHGSPPSLPSFVSDVGFTFGAWVNAQSMAFANTGKADFPLIDPAGSRRALQAEIGGFNVGSDHQVWAEGSWRIPILYLADWPDRYIHTSRDLPDNLDPTKLRRAIFIAAASGYTLASLDAGAATRLWPAMRTGMLTRAARAQRRAEALGAAEVANLWRQYRASEEAVLASLGRFGPVPDAVGADARRLLEGLVPARTGPPPRPSGTVYRRVRREGPMDGFGYSWFDDRLAAAGLPKPRLLERTPDGEGPGFAYEALNLVDGRRSVGEIRDALAASVGTAPVEEVAAYLDTLAKLGVLEPGR
ncbi:MAG TPA: DUF4910 domain-containing protein [Candidatus Polarisedimenticolaceae bacterium]|nr:DUF4910 domain-containing protein [Candidatus Polarisedimenticolaceae bacterium]